MLPSRQCEYSHVETLNDDTGVTISLASSTAQHIVQYGAQGAWGWGFYNSRAALNVWWRISKST
jgi:hypothetical protein